jgi:predicted nucleic-acid-binding protein
MIGIDTNVLVRYVMQDDTRQSPLASRLIDSLTAEAPGFVSIVAVVELAWVLPACYDLTREQTAQALDILLRTKEVVVDAKDSVAKALRVFKAGSADFADCLIERIAAGAGCEKTMTFDVRAAKSAGMTLVQ